MIGEPPVAVIGAGMAGLTAALTVASAGRPCVLFEASDRLGGCCATIPEGVVRLEPAASVVIGAGMLAEAVGPLGVDAPALLEAVQPIVRVAWPSDHFDLIGPVDALADSIAPWAPRDAARLSAFVARGMAVSRRVACALWQWKAGGPMAWIEVARLAGWALSSYRALIHSSFESPRLRWILGSFSDFYAGLPATETPALLGIVPALSIGEGCFEARGGIQRLPETVASRFVHLGGEVRIGQPVRALRLESDRVATLETDAGQTRVAGVVATCDVRRTLALLPDVPRLRAIRLSAWALRPSVACVSILAVEDGDAGMPPVTWVLPGENASGWKDDSGLLSLAAVTCGPGEPGARGVRIGGALRPGSHRRGNIFINSAAAQLRKLVGAAGIRLRIRDARTWGPSDYEAYLGLPGGSAFGFAGSRWQLGPLRLGPRTAIENLMVAGQSCFPGFGIPLTALSGRLAAELLVAPRKVRS